jgi:hypothetical protein
MLPAVQSSLAAALYALYALPPALLQAQIQLVNSDSHFTDLAADTLASHLLLLDAHPADAIPALSEAPGPYFAQAQLLLAFVTARHESKALECVAQLLLSSPSAAAAAAAAASPSTKLQVVRMVRNSPAYASLVPALAACAQMHSGRDVTGSRVFPTKLSLEARDAAWSLLGLHLLPAHVPSLLALVKQEASWAPYRSILAMALADLLDACLALAHNPSLQAEHLASCRQILALRWCDSFRKIAKVRLLSGCAAG